MSRHLAPFRRSFGLELRSFLQSLRTHDLPLIPPPQPPAYDETSDYPRTSTPVVPDFPPPDYDIASIRVPDLSPPDYDIASTPVPDLPPPAYEIAIHLPYFEAPPPTYEEALNGVIENIGEVGGFQNPVLVLTEEITSISNPENQNPAAREFVSIDMPGYSNVRYSRNGISGSTNAGSQLNGGITNTVVAGNLFNVENRNYYSSIFSIPLINSTEGVEFTKRAIFTTLLACVMIYFHLAHPDWMPQWAFIVIICLLSLGLIQHLPALIREYRDNRVINDN